MKTILLLISSLFASVSTAFCQGGCSNIKVISPVVAKPSGASLAGISCDTAIAQWKGSANQSYVVSVIFKSLTTPGKTDTISTTAVTRDGDQNCSASLPVVAGTTVRLVVQASELVDDQFLYSYPLRTRETYPIPACDSTSTAASAARKENAPLAATEVLDREGKRSLIIFPNPVQSVLHLNWHQAVPAGTREKAVISVIDVHGRPVMQRQNMPGNGQLSVRQLSSGTYIIRVESSGGNVLFNGRFIKE